MTATQISFPPSCPRRVRPNITPSRSVCRQLFGPVNHEQMRADLLRERKKLCDENTRRWNFDFENGIPLVGSYVWERLCSNLTRERPVSRLPDCVAETGTSERLACFSLPSNELTTATTTSSGTTKCPVSNDSCANQAENKSLDSKNSPERRLKHTRKTKSSGKITDFLRSTKQRTVQKRSRRSRRKSTAKQTSMDLFIRKH
ncbi:hypothetical protein OS493_017828 [Desmophyllum pertusum]|uniref:Cyclin-dependent kinase inhibitor domain-containing protein n=1 Tax=Desmophyllum pertusum TaxID=174260 RepID=A0A9W9ZDL9_9CNID|nr:hypothetical protein OS493_017828 [Desmophyllum pertusum]